MKIGFCHSPTKPNFSECDHIIGINPSHISHLKTWIGIQVRNIHLEIDYILNNVCVPLLGMWSLLQALTSTDNPACQS